MDKKDNLVKLNVLFKRSHGLDYLLDLIVDVEAVPDEIYDSAEVLEDYGVNIRYPDGWFEPTLEDVEEAYNAAKKLKGFINTRIEKSED